MILNLLLDPLSSQFFELFRLVYSFLLEEPPVDQIPALICDRLQPALVLVVHIKTLLTILSSLLDHLASFAWDIAAHGSNITNRTACILVERSTLSTTEHATNILSKSCSLSSNAKGFFLVGNELRKLLSLSDPLLGCSCSAIHLTSPVALLRCWGSLERHHGGSSTWLKSLLQESGNICACITANKDDRSINIDCEALVISRISSCISCFLNILRRIRHVAVVAVGLISMSATVHTVSVSMSVTVCTVSVSVSVTVSSVNVICGELTMLIDKRNTIGP